MKYILLLAILTSSLLNAKDIKLPEPSREGGLPLKEVLNNRQSTRHFSPVALTSQQLSDLLWAAFGFNRGGYVKRTAPSSDNHQEIDIYLALESGLYLYDAMSNKLIHKGTKDIRTATGKQGFVSKAPLNLVYVANYADNSDLNERDNLTSSGIHVGCIVQNVYLFCASEGLGAVSRGSFDEKALGLAMKLGEGNKIILTQTVGNK